MFTSRLMGAGLAPLQASQILGDTATSLTATGNNQATALTVTVPVNVFTTVAASTGAVLPTFLGLSDQIEIYNLGANTLSVYPPSGGQINTAATNAAISVAAGKGTAIRCISANGLNFVAVTGA